jgi:hypothetical protein
MKIYLVWKETKADSRHSVVVGFCKTLENAYTMCDPRDSKYYYWVEELEELV